jgi:hypothetical protein
LKYGNCWLFALPKWLKNPRKTYLVIRLSHHIPVPHVFFAKSISELEVEEYQPLNPKEGWRAIFHKFWYRGRIRKGKGEE